MFVWKDEFATNVKVFDEEHKKLIQIATKLNDLVKMSDDVDVYDEIMEILSEMVEYTKYHFKHEEELLKEYGYPVKELFKHIAEHKNFLIEVEKMIEKDIDSEQKKVTIELVVFLTDWISNHILKTDMKYREFFAEKNVQL